MSSRKARGKGPARSFKDTPLTPYKRTRGSSLSAIVEEDTPTPVVEEETPSRDVVGASDAQMQEENGEGDDIVLEQGSKMVQEEDEEATSQVSDIDMQMVGCGDVISQCRLLSQEVCPRIPLCRMITHAVVRGIRADMSSLKSAFQYEGYLPEKGSFVVSICKYKGEETPVTPAIVSTWSPLWCEVNATFEEEVLAKPEFSFLSGKMFYVWEGNHRLTAWMELISQMYKENRARHVRVVCSVIDPTRISEVSLLAGLQRVNSMNEYAIVKPSLRDVLWNCNNIFKCDIDAFLSTLPQDQLKLLESLRAKDSSVKGKQQWYPLTRGYLARLVFQVEYTSELHKIEDFVSNTVSIESKEEALKKERAKIHKRLSDKMGMVLNVLDPKLGDQWLDRVFALKFDSPDSAITIAKLKFLANAEMREEKRLVMLSLLDANKRLKDMYAMPSSDNEYRLWLTRECFLEKVEVEAIQALEDLQKICILGSPLDLPQDYLLQDYMEGVKLEARKYLFAQVKAREQAMDARGSKKVEGPQRRKRNEITMAAYRVVYRYLLHLTGEKKIARLPNHCKGWIDRDNDDVCMYPKSMHNLSDWEIDHCPWWVDLGSGYVLARERELYKVHSKKSVDTPLGDRCNIRSQKDTRKESDVIKDRVDNSSKQHEVEERSSVQGGQRVSIKEVISFVFLPCPLDDMLSRKEDAMISYGYMVGDYLSMGQDFVAGKRNDAYKTIHEFFSRLAKHDTPYVRNGKLVKWACDVVFIDFPTGCLIDKETTLPAWNMLTEAHIRLGITVAAASLGDSGWLVTWITLTGDALSWLEKYMHVLGLEVVRRVFVLDKLPYGYGEQCDLEVSSRSSLLIFARRSGCHPPTFIGESSSQFRKLQIDPLSDCWPHYLPERNRLVRPSSSTVWRGSLQRSPIFLLCVLGLLCPPSGLILEMGCGTAPLMRACQASSRPCFSFDICEDIVDAVVRPLVEEVGAKRACLGLDEDLELDTYKVQVVDNPYDD